MNMMELIMDQLSNKETLQQLGQSVKTKPSKVKKAATLGISTLMEALNRNSNTPEGAEALTKALEQHQDDDVSDIQGYLKRVDTEDGAKIIEHVLGNKSKTVQTKLAKKSGMSADQIGKLLIQFAPLILGLLGNKKKEDNLDATGVSNLTSGLSSILGGGSSGGSLLNLASSFLDDSSGSSSSGLGGILGSLGSLFKKK